jgi:hypothetical protein
LKRAEVLVVGTAAAFQLLAVPQFASVAPTHARFWPKALDPPNTRAMVGRNKPRRWLAVVNMELGFVFMGFLDGLGSLRAV